MKGKFLINLGLIIIVAVLATSCFLFDDDETKIQTVEEELSLLNDYIRGLEDEGHDVDTTALGVYYIVMEEGEGEFPQTGDSVTVVYTGYLMDGSLFDSSKLSATDSTYTFGVGDSNIIPGFNDGLKVINEGGRVQLMVRSSLAYGTNGYGYIPPNNSLIFVIRMMDIKPAS